MRTYREVFSVGEFRALVGGQILAAASMTIQSLALSVLVYRTTSSPLLAALGFSAGLLPQAVGAMTLSGLADGIAPRTLLVASDGLRAATFVLMVSGALSAVTMLAVVAISGVCYGALGGVRYALMVRVLSVQAFELGRSVLNMAVGAMQVVGYACGGVLILAVGARASLWLAAALAVIAGIIDRGGLRTHLAQRSGSVSIEASWQRSSTLLKDRGIRRLLLAQWVPNGLIVGAEALFVPYAGAQAAWLFAAAGAGMLTGEVICGRWVRTAERMSLTRALYLMLGVPYVAFAARPSLLIAIALACAASIGYGGTLGLQRRFVQAVPEQSLGQALAVASAGMLSAQGAAAYLIGGLAQTVGASVAMAIAGGVSIFATVVLLAGNGGERAATSHRPGTAPLSSGNRSNALRRSP